jgi:uridine kinase
MKFQMTSSPNGHINPAQPRDTVQVILPDGFVLEGAVGTTIEAFLQAAASHFDYDSAIMGGILDGRLRELAYPVERDATLAPLLLSSSDGGRIYRRTLIMLLTTAVDEQFPGVEVRVSYSVTEGGFYCTLPNRETSFSDAELEQLERHMCAIVEANEPITKKLAPLDEAIAIFNERGANDKLRLMEARERNDLTLYTLRGRSDYHYGYMLPSTGYLQTFRLVNVGDGFIMQYPRKEHPDRVEPFNIASKVNEVFRQTDHWLGQVGVADIGQLNQLVQQRHIQEMVLITEAFHEQRIAAIAQEICDRYQAQGTRLVFIAGPSSSGKTTFSKRLSIQLLAYGLRPYALEMDNYFVDRDLTPRDAEDNFDFESIGAMNLELLNQQLLQLIRGEEVHVPHFDFIAGKSVAGKMVHLADNQIIIMEGIHGLNPALVPHVPPENVFRIYVSALTPLNIDLHNRIPTTDTRLLRRIVRDANARGYNATDTLTRWSSVRRGEKRNIFPNQEHTNVIFNSSLLYELAALRPFAEPLLLQVQPGTQPHIEANRLLSFLGWVRPLDDEQLSLIPDISLLREFIGGSIFKGYQPGSIQSGEQTTMSQI